MTSEVGRRHVRRIRALLTAADVEQLPLDRLIADLDGLLALLRDEADIRWVDELQAHCNRLEFLNALAIDQGRSRLSAEQRLEAEDAVTEMLLMLTPYASND